MALAVVLVFVMGFLYEGLRWLRIYLQKKKPGSSKAKKATSSVQMLQMPESSGAANRADNQVNVMIGFWKLGIFNWESEN